MHGTCPDCGESFLMTWKPTNRLFRRIGLSDGLFCSRCGARLRYSSTTSWLPTISGIPYVGMMAWNIYVAQYGGEHYGQDKIDSAWVLAALVVFAIAITVALRFRKLVVYGDPPGKGN